MKTICSYETTEHSCHSHTFDCYFSPRDDKEGDIEYYAREKMPSGMTAEFYFSFYHQGRFKEEYKLVASPSFIVYKKRS